jgi:hypothetical protein
MADFASIRFQPQRPLLRELSADRLNTILTEIRRNKPKGERGITVRQSGDGTYIGLAAALPAGKGTPTTRQPWDLIATPDPESTSENPPYKIRVQPGTLSEFLATNWNEEFSAQANDTKYAIAEVATDGKAITSVQIKLNSSPPQIQEPRLFALPQNIEILFGVFTGGNALRAIPDGNISLYPRIWFQEARTNVNPGESLFNLYYVLGP